MAKTIEDHYPQIGQEIVDIIQDAWESARVEVEFNPEVLTIRGHYTPKGKIEERSFIPSHKLADLFRDLHSRMVEELHDDWKQALFTMSLPGKFDIHFEY